MLQRLSLQFVFKKGWNQSPLWHQHSRSNNLLSDSKTWTWRGFRRNSFMWTTAYTNCSLPNAGTQLGQKFYEGPFKYLLTLSTLLSVLFYQTTWSEFFKKYLLNDQVHLKKKMIILFYFRAAIANFWALLNNLVWIFGKCLY